MTNKSVARCHSGAFSGLPNGCVAIADGPCTCHTNDGVAEVEHEATKSVDSNRTASLSLSTKAEETDERATEGTFPDEPHPVVNYPSDALMHADDGANKQS